MSDDDELLDKLGEALNHDDEGRTPPADRVAQIRAAAERMRPDVGDPDADVLPLRRAGSGRRVLLVGGAAAGVGGIAGYLARAATTSDDPAGPAAGPPTESIDFTADAGLEVSRSALINHTWGTELLLDVAGLTGGRAYRVSYRTTTDEVDLAGSMLGVDDTLLVCRFNAATLRADLRQIAVTDPDGRDVLVADL